MALLQDRIEQAGHLLERCRGALDFIHRALFPLNPRPEGVRRLLEAFRDGFRIHKFIHREMISSAMSALAWVKAHHRGISLRDIAAGPPPAANGGPMNMMSYYECALKPARDIMNLVHEETARRLQQNGQDTSGMAGVSEAVSAELNIPR